MCRGDGWAIIMNGDYLKWESQMIKLHNRSSTQSGGKKKITAQRLLQAQVELSKRLALDNGRSLLLCFRFSIAHSSGSGQVVTK